MESLSVSQYGSPTNGNRVITWSYEYTTADAAGALRGIPGEIIPQSLICPPVFQ